MVVMQYADIDALDKAVALDAKTIEILKKSTCDQCLERVKTLTTKANIAKGNGNQEAAYFYYMKTCEIALLLSKKDRFKELSQQKRKFVHEIVMKSIQSAELIRSGLKKLYEQESQTKLKNNIFNDEMNTVNVPAPLKQPSVSEFIERTKISPKDLVRLLQNTEPAKSALIIDFREKSDVIIQYPKKNYITVVNVPSRFIQKGLIFNNLNAQMPINARTVLCQLAKYDLVVLMDEMDPEYAADGDLAYATKAYILREALYTYNAAYKPKHRPIVMEGGFQNWKRQYAVYTTEAAQENELDPDSQVVNFETRIAKLQADYGIDFRETYNPPVSYPSIPKLDGLFIDSPKNATSRAESPVPFDFTQDHLDNQKPRPQVPSRDEKPIFVENDYRQVEKDIPFIDRSTKPMAVLGGNRPEDQSQSTYISSMPSASMIPQLDRSTKSTIGQRDPRCDDALRKAYRSTVSSLETILARNENPGQVGLYNIGNTCYVNATLQCLLQTPFLNYFFCGGKFLSHIGPQTKLNTGGLMAAVFSGLMDAVWGGRVKQIRPEYFMKVFTQVNPYFSDGAQHDAQEFMINLLDALHEDTNRVFKPVPLDTNYVGGDQIVHESNDYIKRYERFADSPISNIFDTLRVYELQCRQCGRSSVTFEKWRMLSLEVRSRLEDCFAVHFRDERLEGEEMWECSSCKCKRPATRKARIWRLPPVLIIHLMRFSVTDGGYVKNTDPVHFETTLDVSPWLHPSSTQSKQRYVLYAVTNHRGSLNSGHYTAITQHQKDKSWVRYDDETCTRINSSGFDASAAFILFYKKEDLNQ